MDIRQVIDAANIHPIPGANLLKKEKKTQLAKLLKLSN